MKTKKFAAALCLLAMLCLAACTAPAEEPAIQSIPLPFEARYTGSGIPAEGFRHRAGEAFALDGSVEATGPIACLSLEIYSVFNGDFAPIKAELGFEEDVLSADISAFNSSVDFSLLTPGVHVFNLWAKGRDEPVAVHLASSRFYVEGDVWEQLDESFFYDSYPEALAFFGGDTQAFLFPFQRVKGRYIMAHPDWEQTYITGIPAYPDGVQWMVHTKALPNFEKATAYLEKVHIRVQGRDFDSGVIPLCSLVQSCNGCFVSRFTSSEKYISHHSFGTAIDINAAMEPNLNTAENQLLVRTEVRDCLAYNGILEQNGIPYYSFTYSGSCTDRCCGVPETVVNYLLYELAFYRSGFTWAHYYAQTGDNMHFALTEFVTHDHQGEFGLRKVFSYISEEQ